MSGFIAEFPIFAGMWRASENITLNIGAFWLSNSARDGDHTASLGIVITAARMCCA